MPAVSIYLPFVFDLSSNGILYGEEAILNPTLTYVTEINGPVLSASLMKSAIQYKDASGSLDLSFSDLSFNKNSTFGIQIQNAINNIVNGSINLAYDSQGALDYAGCGNNHIPDTLAGHYVQLVSSILFGHPQAQAPINNDERICIDLSDGDLGGQFVGNKGLSDPAILQFIFEQLIKYPSRFGVPDPSWQGMPFEAGDSIVFRVRIGGALDADTNTSTNPTISTTPISLTSIFASQISSGYLTNNNGSLTVTPYIWTIRLLLA
jgi:hypothetical protein